MNKIIVYSRVSTSKQSLEQQEKTVFDWLKLNGLKATHVISDEGISGGISYKYRNLGKKILPELREGDILIVSEISRLGRSMCDINKLVNDELKPRKIRLIVVDMHIDLDCYNIKASDEMMLSSFSFSAQVEKELTQSRTREAIAARKNKLKSQGNFITKAGVVCTHLGSAKGCDMSAAYSKSIENRKKKARENTNNKLFYGAMLNYEQTHGKITPNTNLTDFVEELNRLGAKTATCMDITYNRCRPMINKIKNMYSIK